MTNRLAMVPLSKACWRRGFGARLFGGGRAVPNTDGSFGCDGDEREEHQPQRDEAPPADDGVRALVVGYSAGCEGERRECEDGDHCAMKVSPEHGSPCLRRGGVCIRATVRSNGVRVFGR